MKKSFWCNTSRYGVIHRPDGFNVATDRVTLVVYVHGIFGDCTKTWGRMPQWVLEQAGIDVEVVSFDYPAGLLQRTSIVQAAEDLGTWLETEFSAYRHIILVAHSSGGLVVKEMLRQSFERLQSFSSGQGPLVFADVNSPWLRVRRVINIAVPHQGGSPLLSWLGYGIYSILYFFAAPALGMVRLLTQGGKDWGRNSIIQTLRWKNSWLSGLEAEFTRQQEQARELNMPVPLIHDIYAKSDLSVPIASEIGQREIYIRGTHQSIKIPNRASAPIVAVVAKLVKRYAGDLALLVTDKTLLRIAEVNRILSADSLIKDTLCGIGEDWDRPQPVIAGAHFGVQQEIVDRVVQAIENGSDRPRQLVVTGAAGVGKSLVLRAIAWRLGCAYLAKPGPMTPVPLFLPLQQVTVINPSVGSYSWDNMWVWWRHFGKSLFSDLPDDEDWLARQLPNHSSVVILDGIDDFLLNNPMVGLATIVSVLREAIQRYNNPRFTIVSGISNSFQGVQRLASDSKYIYEISRLSVVQAKTLYPSCRDWIDHVQDRQLLDLILTPLILSHYEPDPACKLGGSVLTQTAVMCQTIRTILSRSHLVGTRAGQGQTVETDHLGRSLALVAWLFFYKCRGELNIEVLRKEAAELRQRWVAFFDGVGQCDETFYLQIQEERTTMLAAFDLLADPDVCNGLLQRTVFVPIGSRSVRFAHLSWQEFLLAQHFVFCFKTHHFEELGIAAFHLRIYRIAGESFQGRAVTESCIQTLLETWQQSHNNYITGNVIAFLTWTQIAIDARAIALLLGQLTQFDGLSRLVLIGGLGYRVLAAHPADYSCGDLRRAFLPPLRALANPATVPVDDPVVSSLSWCYLRAFAQNFALPGPESAWPSLGFEDAETLKALAVVCTIKDGRCILDERSRSLQLALLVTILEIYKDPMLAIRAVHYLYYLVVVVKHGAHVIELSQELPSLFEAGGRFEQIIESLILVPEVHRLYRCCQAFYRKIEAAVI